MNSINSALFKTSVTCFSITNPLSTRSLLRYNYGSGSVNYQHLLCPTPNHRSSLFQIDFQSIVRQKRCYTLEPTPNTARHWTKNFKDVSMGVSTLMATVISLASFFYSIHREEDANTKIAETEAEKKRNSDLISAAQKLGLAKIIPAFSRTLEEQAEDYSKAKHDLYIIGMTGTRIFDTQHKCNNPIPIAIRQILARGVNVYLTIYDPHVFNSSQITAADVNKIKTSLEAAKKLESEFPDLFHVHVIKSIPPFHGDIIDVSEAHVIPVVLKGLRAQQNAYIEVYKEGAKIGNIRNDFKTIWEKGEKYGS